MHKVLKPFPYSPNGIKVVDLKKGDLYEIHPDVVEGLEDAGYIGDPDKKDGAAPSVPPPADFDPATADEATLRTFLEQAGAKPHHKVGEAKLRAMAVELLAKG